MMQRTANENVAGLRRICKIFDQPKNRKISNVTMGGKADYYVENLTGQRHNRVQTEGYEL